LFVLLSFFFWPLYCLSFYLRFLCSLLAIVCPIYGFCVPFWPLSVLLFTVSRFPCGHCIVCPSIYGFWVSLCPLSVLLFTVSVFPYGHWLSFYLRFLGSLMAIVCPSIYGFWAPFWPLYCLSFYLRFLGSLLAIVLCVLLFTVSGFPFGNFKLFWKPS
jgi:hypothetical protein